LLKEIDKKEGLSLFNIIYNRVVALKNTTWVNSGIVLIILVKVDGFFILVGKKVLKRLSKGQRNWEVAFGKNELFRN
jgi:hypothetical protein